MRTAVTILALAAVLLVGASAQQRPAPLDPNSEEASMLGYGDREKSCVEWTDGCMSCTRGADGDPQCPNIGIACQPKAISCVKKSEPAKQ